MVKFSKTWWGQKFIEAIESFTESNRLGRGRSYARNNKIKDYVIEDGCITAFVRGSINPYFGVYKEPLYTTTVEIPPISQKDWSKAIDYLGSKASLVAKLLVGEVPENIEDAFAALNLHLLPHSRKDFHTECSCPDWSNPCKHIAGVCYLLASEFDRDPFLLFELRGMPRSQLQKELSRTSLGRVLSSALDEDEANIEPAASYYTQPQTVEVGNVPALKDFWSPPKRLPQQAEAVTPAVVPGIVVKKGGDYPPFWTKDSSFLTAMEEVYDRVRTKNKGVF
ncbi:hypothetical protein CKA32_005219 [Geitlerinema sp. FC II]|uniref:SWIM zinc finger family protein n=1 Tax=Baaleninema simplex TaxID=2862350 RepID=UPI000345342D|nr:SWIM zinc finger family protein [Baaleninema simplex]MDC0835576.1 SWIM zinc finger family protein [Geitlerinema sp. CS-897]PPT05130.1 hypothetical protein CKA32_005219 [Geitlerinema sp. FC II]